VSSLQNELEADESSGITSLRPVPVKTASYAELVDGDSTHYLSVSELLDRGKGLGAQPCESPLLPQPAAPDVGFTARADPNLWRLWRQFRAAPAPLKASLVLLPVALVALLLLAKPVVHRPLGAAPGMPSARIARPIVAALMTKLPAKPVLAASQVVLPRGVSLVRAAADAVATGDFSRAAQCYRELALREPNNRAYVEGARILAERGSAAAR
jgi:hypothetical protein